MNAIYDCLIIGGGIAGLQAAIQLGRYKHSVLILDCNEGRSVLCRSYHNMLGWPDGISGEYLRSSGKKQAQTYGVVFVEDFATGIERCGSGMLIKTKKQAEFKAHTVLLATGVKDRIPDIKNLKACLGISIYICPDCDGYEVSNKKTVVLGSGNTGAKLAAVLTYWTDDITYVNHDKEKVDPAILNELKTKGIAYIEDAIIEVDIASPSLIRGVLLEREGYVHAERAFIAFGGNQVRTKLADSLGIELNEKQHVMVNARTKETSVKGVWAAGDIVNHSEQATIAMGDGSQAAIWIHKRLMDSDS
ncbi:NAD(P)/FAD-dependent oxidoreductase [Ectobacillus panaciterrae]|uniref:NAD(P)/FAD-dependent oxidoreductase n=1 Tax=Ectobacillus panaciterrae TaxID=363872 RepID=UPI00040697DD|nr:NAD(P)/FAD-dependent oxidoreductase [Ectobacillus panaciterrae]